MATVTELVEEVTDINKIGIKGLHKLGVDIPADSSTRKIVEAMNSITNIEPLLDGTVRFMSEGEVFHLVTGAVGQEITIPTISPTSESGTAFFSWYDENGAKVSFPYAIGQGVTDLNAVFSEVDITMEVKEAGTVLGYLSDGTAVTKNNDETAVIGYVDNRYGNPFIHLISDKPNAVNVDGATTVGGTFTYNEKTYYGKYFNVSTSNDINSELHIKYIGSTDSYFGIAEVGTQILNKYFMVG
ncbi:MAG: hypothetical protein ACI4IF_08200 [Acutalibacteraceae bacterium]